MSKKRAIILILFSLELAVLIPLGIALVPKATTTRHISIDARRFGYTPARIIVNKGDKVILRFSTSDVTHGFQLDGYPIDLIARKGVTFKRNTWQQENGHLKTNWNRVSTVKFVANRTGKFIFRCTETCGNLHPFMTGELIVRPNMAYHFFISLSIWVVFATFVWVRFTNPAGLGNIKRINLLEKFPWLKRLVMRRSFQFWFIAVNFIVFYLFILSSLWGSPVGNRNIAIVFVWILWWFVLKAILVPLGGRLWCLMCPLPACRMALPYKPDGSQVPERTFRQATSSVPRPPKRLAQDHTQYLAAEYSFSMPDFIRHDSDYAPIGNGSSIFIYSSRHTADDVYLPASGVLPVPVPGGRIFGHLFHGIYDRGPLHRS
jgi:plastocyanin